MNPLVELRRDPASVTVVLRPYRRWSKLIIPGVLAGTGAGLLAAARATGAGWTGVLAALGGQILLLALLAAALVVSWHLLGREVVTASPEALTLAYFIVKRRRLRTFAARDVRELRATPGGRILHRGRSVSAAPALAFEHHGETVSFGAGLEGAQAEQVIAELRAVLGSPFAAAR